MIIIPAIDILEGEVVRLTQGQFDRSQIYSSDPLSVAQAYQRLGATWLHVVDLSGAQDKNLRQIETIKAICENTQLKIQVGGGIRTKQDIETLFEIGVDRVVIGTIAITNPDEVLLWKKNYGEEKIIVALDVKTCDNDYNIKVSGWSEETTWSLLEYVEQYQPSYILCTDIDSDGMLSGPKWDLYRDLLSKFPTLSIQASGGVATVDDLIRLKCMGVKACIVGKALLENRFTLQEALEVTNAS